MSEEIRKIQTGNRKSLAIMLQLSTSVEIHLGIELPVAMTNIAGNADEGSQIITNKEQVHKHHACQVKVDIADAHPVK